MSFGALGTDKDAVSSKALIGVVSDISIRKWSLFGRSAAAGTGSFQATSSAVIIHFTAVRWCKGAVRKLKIVQGNAHNLSKGRRRSVSFGFGTMLLSVHRIRVGVADTKRGVDIGWIDEGGATIGTGAVLGRRTQLREGLVDGRLPLLCVHTAGIAAVAQSPLRRLVGAAFARQRHG